jgi:hypothetical protein
VRDSRLGRWRSAGDSSGAGKSPVSGLASAHFSSQINLETAVGRTLKGINASGRVADSPRR